MKILISGSHGLIGSALVAAFTAEGHTLGRLVRRKADRSQNEVYWDAERGSVDKSALEDFGPEVVINLAGESIAGGRWTEKRKAKIRDSRVNGTRALAGCLASLSTPPKLLINASAVGFFGSRGEEVLTEASKPGEGFLAETCREWESATEPAQKGGIRVVLIRTGLVLSPEGGPLKKMLLPFKLGAGGILGNGRQYWSWIALDDMVGAIQFIIKTPSLEGPVIMASPHPVTNREFTKTLGRVLFRPTCLPLPASTARLVFGEMADEALLASARVQPEKLELAGFKFQYPDLEPALKHLLK